MKKRYIPLVLIAILFLAYWLGPKPTYPAIEGNIELLNYPIESLEKYIAEKEAKVVNLKPNNESRIVWADSLKKTEYSVVYLHGFSASPMESDPVHYEFSKRYGCNLYLARLAQHGVKDKEIFKDLTPKQLIDSAKEAIAIARLIGEKVIVMSCSTGSTISTYLAAENPDLIDAQIMYSPNISLHDKNAKLLTKPWGLQMLRYMVGSDYRSLNMPEAAHNYWTMNYRIEGLLAVQGLIDATMTEAVFSKINQPLFVGYYYENEENKDKIISTQAADHFFEAVSTPIALKHKANFPNARAHVVSSKYQAKDLEDVSNKTYEFAEEVLEMKAVGVEAVEMR